MPHRREQIDSTLPDVGRHSGMRGVEVTQGALSVASENGNGRVLTAIAVFTA